MVQNHLVTVNVNSLFLCPLLLLLLLFNWPVFCDYSRLGQVSLSVSMSSKNEAFRITTGARFFWQPRCPSCLPSQRALQSTKAIPCYHYCFTDTLLHTYSLQLKLTSWGGGNLCSSFMNPNLKGILKVGLYMPKLLSK